MNIKNFSSIKSLKRMNKKFWFIPPLEIAKVLIVMFIFLIISSGLTEDLRSAGITETLGEELLANADVEGYQQVFMNSIEDQEHFRKQFLVTLVNLGKRVIAALVLVSAALAFTNTISWNIVLRNKWSWKFLGRYWILNSVWILFWTGSFLIVALKFKPQFVFQGTIIWLILFFYSTLIAFPALAQEKTLLKAMKKARTIAFKKPHYIILEMVVLYSIYSILVLLFIASAIRNIVFVYIILLLALVALSWMKYYSYEVVYHD
jgi:hypothetical protein